MGNLEYARDILSQKTGIPRTMIPDDIVKAQFAAIKAKRAIRSAELEKAYPAVVNKYLAGATTYQLSEEFGFDRARISKILRDAGVSIKRRPFCPRGHEMTEANTAYTPQGCRRCRKCSCENSARHYRKKRGAL